MRRTFTAGLAVLAALSCRTPSQASQSTVAPAAEPGSAQAQSPEVRAINEQFVRDISARIAGHENEPAEKVFENVQWLKGVTARNLLTIMNGGYAAALGVTCSHCHVTSDFASDDKRPKRAAREMAVMHRQINTSLRQMKELASDTASNRAINCAVCHRGMIDPRKPLLRR